MHISQWCSRVVTVAGVASAYTPFFSYIPNICIYIYICVSMKKKKWWKRQAREGKKGAGKKARKQKLEIVCALITEMCMLCVRGPPPFPLHFTIYTLTVAVGYSAHSTLPSLRWRMCMLHEETTSKLDFWCCVCRRVYSNVCDCTQASQVHRVIEVHQIAAGEVCVLTKGDYIWQIQSIKLSIDSMAFAERRERVSQTRRRRGALDHSWWGVVLKFDGEVGLRGTPGPRPGATFEDYHRDRRHQSKLVTAPLPGGISYGSEAEWRPRAGLIELEFSSLRGSRLYRYKRHTCVLIKLKISSSQGLTGLTIKPVTFKSNGSELNWMASVARLRVIRGHSHSWRRMVLAWKKIWEEEAFFLYVIWIPGCCEQVWKKNTLKTRNGE